MIIGIKPAPGDHESNFKKVGSIPWEPCYAYNEIVLSPNHNNLYYKQIVCNTHSLYSEDIHVFSLYPTARKFSP